MKTFRCFSISIALLIVVCLSSCAHKPSVPSDIIQPDQMVKILEEICLTDGFFSAQTHFHFDTLHPEMIGCYDSLFPKFQVSPELFDTSFYWYVQHPDVFAPICDTLVAHMSLMQ